MIIPPIIIDTSQLIERFNIPPRTINVMLDSIAKGLAASYAIKLEKEAQIQLKQTKQRYVNNIRVVDSGKCSGTVLLDFSKDPLIQMLEEGASPFDEKAKLLSGRKSKMGKNGKRYVTVPFRFGVPTAQADNPLFNGGIMPQVVYNIVSQQPQTVPISGGGVRSGGLSLNDIPSQFRVPRTRAAITDSNGNIQWRTYVNRSAQHEGMVRINDSVTGQNRYMTFRRISEPGENGKGGSDPDSWIHPGIKQYHLIQASLSKFNIPTETGLQLDSELTKLGF